MAKATNDSRRRTSRRALRRSREQFEKDRRALGLFFQRRRNPACRLASRSPDAAAKLERLLQPEIRNGAIKKGFETVDDARAEDARRLQLLRTHRGRLPRTFQPLCKVSLGVARHLAQGLENGIEDDALFESFASALFVREFRDQHLGRLTDAVARYGADQVKSVTLLPNELVFTPKKFAGVAAAPLLQRLRSAVMRRLRRLKLKTDDGFLVAYLDGDFDVSSRTFRLHFHGVASGAYVTALKSLRKDARNPAIRNKLFRVSEDIDKPIRVAALTNPPRQIAYACKGYWRASQAWENNGRTGRTKFRLPPTEAVMALLWLHRCRLSDLQLVMGRLPGFSRDGGRS